MAHDGTVANTVLPPSEWATLEDAAGCLGVEPGTIQDHVDFGVLRGVRLKGGGWLLSRVDLERLLAMG